MDSIRKHQRHARCGRFPAVAFFFCLAWMTAFTSCATPSYVGRVAKPENNVAILSGDVHELQWQTGDLTIYATYALTQNQLELAGHVELQNKLRKESFPIVNYLRIATHALDGAGIILDSFPLWRAQHETGHDFIKWTFQRSYTIPEGTRALAFSYRGRVGEGGGQGPRRRNRDGGRSSWDFWYTP